MTSNWAATRSALAGTGAMAPIVVAHIDEAGGQRATDGAAVRILTAQMTCDEVRAVGTVTGRRQASTNSIHRRGAGRYLRSAQALRNHTSPGIMRDAAALVALALLGLLAPADARTAFAVLAVAPLPDVQAPVHIGFWPVLLPVPGRLTLGLLGQTRHKRQRSHTQGGQDPGEDTAAGCSRAKRASQSVKAGGVHGGGPFQGAAGTRRASLHPRDKGGSCQINLHAVICGSWRITASVATAAPHWVCTSSRTSQRSRSLLTKMTRQVPPALHRPFGVQLTRGFSSRSRNGARASPDRQRRRNRPSTRWEYNAGAFASLRDIAAGENGRPTTLESLTVSPTIPV